MNLNLTSASVFCTLSPGCILKSGISSIALVTKLKMERRAIGAIFNKDQSSITHSLNVVNDNLSFKFDNEYKTHVENLNVII